MRQIVPVGHANRNWLHGMGPGADRLRLASQSRPEKLPPQANMWWWNPSRSCLERPAQWFEDQLAAFDPDIKVVKDGYHHRWNVWVKSPRMRSEVCGPWKLLFHTPYYGQHIFERLIEASVMKWGNSTEYFRHIERQMAREKEAQERASSQDTIDRAMVAFDHSQIKVSMYGPSSGSKFTKYHS